MGPFITQSVAAVSPQSREAEDLPEWISSLATAYGDVAEVHLAPGAKDRPLIIHIQDAHDQYDAQKNIARLIESLQAGAGIALVGVEGATGGFNLAPYRNFPRPQFIRDAAENLLRSNLIAGPEYAGWTSEKEPTLWGVEDTGPYLANIQAFKEGLPRQAELKGRLRVWQSQLDLLKFHLYSAEMREHDRRRAEQRSGKLPIADYVRSLAQALPAEQADRLGVRFPHINLFLQALDLEDDLNFAQVEKERLVLLQRLSQTLSQPQMTDLLNKSVLYRMGRLSYGGFHSFLAFLCGRSGIDLDLYQQMSRYIRYALISDRLRGGEILQELAGLEGAARGRWLIGRDQRDLFELSEDVSLVDRLSDFAMSPEDWKSYGDRRPEIANIAERIKALSRRANFFWREDDGRPLQADLAPFENFCARALERNGVLVGNLLAKMESSGQTSAVLVAGGFHSEGLTDLLREKRVSYAVVTPKINEIDADVHSLDALSGEKLPLEKLFAAETITLKSPRFTAVVDPAPGFESFQRGVNGIVALGGAQDMAAHGTAMEEIEASLRKFGMPLIRWKGKLPSMEELASPRVTMAELKNGGKTTEVTLLAVRADAKDSPAARRQQDALRQSGETLMEGICDGLYLAIAAPIASRRAAPRLSWIRQAAPWAVAAVLILASVSGLILHSSAPPRMNDGLQSLPVLGMTFLFLPPQVIERAKNFLGGLRDHPKRALAVAWAVSLVVIGAHEFTQGGTLIPGLAGTAWHYLTEWFSLTPTMGSAYPYLGVIVAVVVMGRLGYWLIKKMIGVYYRFAEWFDHRSETVKNTVWKTVEKTELLAVIGGAILVLYVILKDWVLAAGLWANQALTPVISPAVLFTVLFFSSAFIVLLSRKAMRPKTMPRTDTPIVPSMLPEKAPRSFSFRTAAAVALLSVAGSAFIVTLDLALFQGGLTKSAAIIGLVLQPFIGTAFTLLIVVGVPAVFILSFLAKALNKVLQRALDGVAEFMTRRGTSNALEAMAENMGMPLPARVNGHGATMTMPAMTRSVAVMEKAPRSSSQEERLKNLYNHLAALRQILDRPVSAAAVFDLAMEQIAAARLYAELRTEDVSPHIMGDSAFFNLSFGAQALLDMTTELEQRLVTEADGRIRALVDKALQRKENEEPLSNNQRWTLRGWSSQRDPLSVDTLDILRGFLKENDPMAAEIDAALTALRRIEEQAVVLRLVALEAEYLFEALGDIATVRRFSGYYFSFKPWTKGFSIAMEYFTLSALGMRAATKTGMRSIHVSVARFAHVHNALARLNGQEDPLQVETFVAKIAEEAASIRERRRETKSPFAADAAWHSGRRMGIRFYTSVITLVKTYGVLAPALLLSTTALAGTSVIASAAGAPSLANVLQSLLYDVVLGAGLTITLHWFFIFVSGILYEKFLTRLRLRYIWRLERNLSAVFFSPRGVAEASGITAANLKAHYADIMERAKAPQGRPALHVFIMRRPVAPNEVEALRKALRDSPLWDADRPFLIMTTAQENGMAYLDAYNILAAIARSTLADIRELREKIKDAEFAAAIRALSESDGVDKTAQPESAQQRGRYIGTLMTELALLDQPAYDYFQKKRSDGAEYLLEAAITLMRQPDLFALAEELAGIPMDGYRDADGRLPLEKIDVAFILDHSARSQPLEGAEGPLMPVLREVLNRPETLLERGLARAAQAVQRPLNSLSPRGSAIFLDLGQPFAGVIPPLQEGTVLDIVTVQAHRDQIVNSRSPVVVRDHRNNVVGFIAPQGRGNYNELISSEIKGHGIAGGAQTLPASTGLIRIGYPGDSRVPSFLSRILSLAEVDETSLKFDRDVLANIFRVLMERKQGTYEGFTARNLARQIGDINRLFSFFTMVSIMTPNRLRGVVSSASGTFITLPPDATDLKVARVEAPREKAVQPEAVVRPVFDVAQRLAPAFAFLRGPNGLLAAALISAAGIVLALVFFVEVFAWIGIALAVAAVAVPRLFRPTTADETEPAATTQRLEQTRPLVVTQQRWMVTTGFPNMIYEKDAGSETVYFVPRDTPVQVIAQTPGAARVQIEYREGDRVWTGFMDLSQLSETPAEEVGEDDAVVLQPLDEARTVIGKLNILAQRPDVDAKVVTTVPAGATVRVTGMTPDQIWYRVGYSEGLENWTGYILASQFVEVPEVEPSSPDSEITMENLSSNQAASGVHPLSAAGETAEDPGTTSPKKGGITGLGFVFDSAAEWLVRLANYVESPGSKVSPELARIGAAVGAPAFAFGLLGQTLAQSSPALFSFFNVSTICGFGLGIVCAFILFALFVKKLVRAEIAQQVEAERTSRGGKPLLGLFPPALLLLLIIVPVGFFLLWAHRMGYLNKVRSWITWKTAGITMTVVMLTVLGLAIISNPSPGMTPTRTPTAITQTFTASPTFTPSPTFTLTPTMTASPTGTTVRPNATPTGTATLTAPLPTAVATGGGATPIAPTLTAPTVESTEEVTAEATLTATEVSTEDATEVGTEDATAEATLTATEIAMEDATHVPTLEPTAESTAPSAPVIATRSPTAAYTNGTTDDRISVYQDPTIYADNHNRVNRLAGRYSLTVVGTTSFGGHDWYVVDFDMGELHYNDKYVLQSDVTLGEAPPLPVIEFQPAVAAGDATDRVTVYQDPSVPADNSNVVGRLAGGHLLTITGTVEAGGRSWYIVSFSAGGLNYNGKYVLQSDVRPVTQSSAFFLGLFSLVTVGFFRRGRNGKFLEFVTDVPGDAPPEQKFSGIGAGAKASHSTVSGGLETILRFLTRRAILIRDFIAAIAVEYGNVRRARRNNSVDATVFSDRAAEPRAPLFSFLTVKRLEAVLVGRPAAAQRSPFFPFRIVDRLPDALVGRLNALPRLAFYIVPLFLAIGLQLPWQAVALAVLLPLSFDASPAILSLFVDPNVFPEPVAREGLSAADRLLLAERIGVTPEIINVSRTIADAVARFTPDAPGLAEAERILADWFSTLTHEQRDDFVLWFNEIFGWPFDSAAFGLDLPAALERRSFPTADPDASWSPPAVHNVLLARMMELVETRLRDHLDAQGMDAAKVPDLPRQLLALRLAAAHGNLRLKTILTAMTGTPELADSLGTLADQRAGQLRLLPAYIETFQVRSQLHRPSLPSPNAEIVRILNEMPLRHPNVSAITIRLMPVTPSRLAKEQRSALKRILITAKSWPTAGRPESMSAQQYEALLNFAETAGRLAPYLTDRERNEAGFDAALDRLIESVAAVHAKGTSFNASLGEPSFIGDDLKSLVTLLRTGETDEMETIVRRIDSHYNDVRGLLEASQNNAIRSFDMSFPRRMTVALADAGRKLLGWMGLRSTVSVYKAPVVMKRDARGMTSAAWDRIGADDPRANSLINEIRSRLIGLPEEDRGSLALFVPAPEDDRQAAAEFLRTQFPEVSDATWSRVALFTFDEVADGGRLSARKLSDRIRRTNGKLLFAPKINLYTDDGAVWDFTGMSAEDIVLFLFNTLGQIVRIQADVNDAARRAAYLKVQA